MIHRRFDKQEILKCLHSNLRIHMDLYGKAITVFRRLAIQALKQKIEELERSEYNTIPHDEDYILDLPVPTNFYNDYQDAIYMLKIAEGTFVEMTREEFGQWCTDKWKWKEDFEEKTLSYLELET